MYGQQSPIPPATADALRLQQAVESGQAQMMTPDNQPTVVADLMQAAMPPQMPPQMAPQMPMQAAGMGQAINQAGLAAQIQAMQQQKAQEAMMQQAMAQQGGMAGGGIATLNSDIDGFAEGGIVGYAGYDESYAIDPQFDVGSASEEEPRLRVPGKAGLMTPAQMRAEGYPEEYIQRRLQSEGFVKRPAPAAPAPAPAAQGIAVQATVDPVNMYRQLVSMPNIPPQERQAAIAELLRQYPGLEQVTRGGAAPAPAPAPEMRAAPSAPSYPAVSPSAQYFDRAREEAQRAAVTSVAPDVGVQKALDAMAAEDQLRAKLGLPALADQIKQQSEEYRALMEERQRLIAQRLQEARQEREEGQLGAYLRGARGRTLGETLGGAEQARSAFDAAMRGQVRGFEDLQLEVRALQVEKQRALTKMRDDIAMGKYKEAMQEERRIRDINSNLNLKFSEISKEQAKEVGAEFRSQMQLKSQTSEVERMVADIERLSGKPVTAESRMELIERLRGAGRGVLERQELSELKSLQQNLQKQLENVYAPKEREAIMQQLARVNARIAEMAGVPLTDKSGADKSDLLKRADAIVGGGR